jgi:hypothetical protein
MRLRVAPPPASSRSARVASPGCPVPRSLCAEPASCASGCPLASGLRLCRRWMFELPRTSHAFDVAGFSKVPGRPGCARPLLQRPRCRTLGCPLSCTSGFTGDRSSSRLDSLSFGGAGCGSSELPRRFAPPVSPTISIRVAPNAHPPAPADGMSELPRIAHLPVRLGGISGLLRTLRFGYADQPISRLP